MYRLAFSGIGSRHSGLTGKPIRETDAPVRAVAQRPGLQSGMDVTTAPTRLTGLPGAAGTERALPAGAARASVRLRVLGQTDYQSTWIAMRAFTDARDDHTPDELWLTEHPAVFTLGQAGRAEHLHDAGPIPVVGSDRGGQVTYHGPGQVILYVLIALRPRGLGVRALVRLLEQAVIECLGEFAVPARGQVDAPGVYVGQAKVAALGLKIRRGASYHGLALNVDMDLTPFARIDPCGYPGLAVTQTRDLGIDRSPQAIGELLAQRFLTLLNAHYPIRPR